MGDDARRGRGRLQARRALIQNECSTFHTQLRYGIDRSCLRSALRCLDRYVHAVIPNAPVTHTCSKPGEAPTQSERMVDEYKLHLFAVGREYKNVAPGKPDYYELPRSRGSS